MAAQQGWHPVGQRRKQRGTSPRRVSTESGGRSKKHQLPGWDHKALRRRCKAFYLKAAAWIESSLHAFGLRQSAGSVLHCQWLWCPSQALSGGCLSKENRMCAFCMFQAVKQPSTIPLRPQPACPILFPNPDEDTVAESSVGSNRHTEAAHHSCSSILHQVTLLCILQATNKGQDTCSPFTS